MPSKTSKNNSERTATTTNMKYDDDTCPPSGVVKKNMLTDELDELEQAMDQDGSKMKKRFGRVGTGIKYQWKLAKRNPQIMILSFIVFAVLCAAGLAMIFMVESDKKEEVESIALDLSSETGRWFSDQLDQAILPLFSLAQFASELEIFESLPDAIGVAHEPGSLPFLPPITEESPVTHRNVSGVCDDPELVERFTKIASTVKRNAKMDGVLVNLQLAPEAVVCLLHPMVNTEDFPPGVSMDNSGAWGHDLLTDPARKFIAEATLPADDVVIAGPVALRQCLDCDATVEKAFIARIPIEMEGHEIMVNGVPYERWGFAVALINWNALIERSDVYATFRERGLEFQLTRTDVSVDSETQEKSESIVVLAETPDFAAKKDSSNLVTTALDTTNNEWVMTVSYEYDSWESWKVGGVVATVFVSFAIGMLCFYILIQKENLAAMKKRYDEDIAQPQKLRLRNFLEQTKTAENTMDIQTVMNSKPIADLFPNVTVLVATISGFESWSSEREASQVFVLLQSIFFSFDKIAKKHSIFKVDTTGDCFVAASGVPEAQEDNALKMVKFARECMSKATELFKALELNLGPDTGDLSLRVGVHSGPVTVGVLMGETSHVQLLGRTMETAAAMEQAGRPGRIHLSQTTVEQLLASGVRKRSIERRKDGLQIIAGRSLQTYWVRNNVSNVGKKSHAAGDLLSAENGSVAAGDSTSQCSDGSGDSDIWGEVEEAENLMEIAESEQQGRLIEWQVNIFTKLAKQIVARRGKKKGLKRRGSSDSMEMSLRSSKKDGTPLDEVAEIVELPGFDASVAVTMGEVDAVTIKPEVISQLRELVTEIAGLYRSNPFHNFAHASHVTMAVHKMLNRIISPEEVNYEGKTKSVLADMHKYTFGINSDPLTHFAIVWSALIHDVDHPGVSNAQLGVEQPEIAAKYSQSLAEQNSVDLAWDLLMKPCYEDLRSCLFGDKTELQRFRQLTVNVVLATDIFDKVLKELRQNRWDRAFQKEQAYDGADISESCVLENSANSSGSGSGSSEFTPHGILKLQDTNRKATIVIEHIIQASDVAHTMQHWDVYKKWNERLFQEMYVAWKMGRAAKDPSEGWYKGEIWFFDNYVIPLGHKLSKCGVFGVASDECLHNALENRKEWVLQGEAVVAEMVARCQKMRLMPQVAEGEEEDDFVDEQQKS